MTQLPTQALEVTVQERTDSGWKVVAEWTSPETLPVRTEGRLQLDLEALDTEGDPRRYGTLLAQGLWGDAKVWSLFERAREKAESRLHVFLVIEDPELMRRRWERLCASGDDDPNFLVLDQRTPFSLYIPSSIAGTFPPIGRADMRALVCVASPKSLDRFQLTQFDAAATVDTVRRALGGIPFDVLGAVDGSMGPPTLDALSEQLTAKTYALLHLVCHGLLGNDGETTIFLADDARQADPITATLFLDRLSGLGGKGGLPRLIFLGTCMSAAPEAEGALGGLAQRLVRKLGIPAVVAMTDRVLIKTAEALTSTFYRYVLDHGLVDLALAEAYAGLDPSKHSIAVPTLFSRLGGRPLFSEALDRELSPAQIESGLERLNDLLVDRGPVLLDAFQGFAADLRRTLQMDLASLPDTARRQRDRALDGISKICAEVLEPLDFHGFSLGQNPPSYKAEEPFRGLYPFRFEDRKFFRGREDLVARLMQRLTKNGFLAVLGPSGSGKSSLVLAGLVPALDPLDENPDVAYMTPGSDPSVQLIAALEHSGARTLLIVDQFEELFTQTAASARAPFIAQLLGEIGKRPVILAMRADFLGECASFENLRALIQDQQELIGPMDTAELRRAMELQANDALLKFEGGLAGTILEEVQNEPGAMPLLQHALRELWMRRHGRWLRLDEYDALGRVRGAIAQTADKVLKGLPSDERMRVRDIFLRLRLDVSGSDGTWRDTRRRVAMEELIPDGTDPSATKALVKRLADARLVVTDQVAGVELVEVAHEALIRHWPQLQEWVREDREGLRLRQEVGQAAQAWDQSANDGSYLVHRGTRLGLVKVWLSRPGVMVNEIERRYIEACAGFEEREREKEEAQRRKNLSQTGWGVIFAADSDPSLRQALRPLLEHRREQAAKRQESFYREFIGADGYQKGETARAFLARHGAGSGPVEPQIVPFYLLIVGDPEEVPFAFQYQLDVQYAVGRVHFGTPEEYEHYARSVVEAETVSVPVPPSASFFAPRHADDRATQMMVDYLLTPLAARVENDFPTWSVRTILDVQATKARLGSLLGGDETPALLFAGGHGMAFLNGDARQPTHQGAPLCAEWPGPIEWRKAIPPDFYFSADDIDGMARLTGTIAFLVAPYSAGTPLYDDFPSAVFGKPEPIAPHSFVARLPQTLLAAPKGGALAVVGHVDRTWANSFVENAGGQPVYPRVFHNTLERVMEGHPVGSAMEYFGQRFAELSAQLMEEMQLRGPAGPTVIDLWYSTNDARNYVILGDPAVRLVGGEASEKPTNQTATEMHRTIGRSGEVR